MAGRLRWKDIYLQADGSVEVVLPPGKSCRTFRTVAIVAREDVLDAGLWLGRVAASLPAERRVGDFPVFVSFVRTRAGLCNYWAVSRGQFVDRFKKGVKDVLGFDPRMYAGYSLRRGGVTEVLSAPLPPPMPAVKHTAGWVPDSTAFNKYFDSTGHKQLRLPSAALLPT